ncbi:SRPBCC family protein [Mediterranea massiliensis]|jgi:hypothetical protein|uniref:SRPBCC family protein n=1 Tax=Mediterranea massiliensis TaxID=1841865 RepID=UPI0025A32D42|nr:SRPBCC family protein [Mediterranea massiliensis]MDM8338962.1 SRPBCC family protein [Mediterranea massiliensis]
MIISTIHTLIPTNLQTVWNTVTSFNDYGWRSDLKNIEVHSSSSFTEYTNSNVPTLFTITLFKPFCRYEFDMKNENFIGHWTGVFRETANGTEIIFTETITIKKWWLRPFAKIYIKKQQRRYIADLKKQCLK